MALDSCITDIFSEANAPSDSGSVGSPHYSGYLVTETETETDTLDFADDVFIGPDTGSSGIMFLTITGTWSGIIRVGQFGQPTYFYSSNVSNLQHFGTLPNQPFVAEFRNSVYFSGAAIVTMNVGRNKIKILSGGAFVGFLKLE